MRYPKVLVAAPVTDLYEYCWEDFKNFLLTIDYPNYEVFLVDNSETDKFFKKIKKEKSFKVEKIKKEGKIRDIVVKSHNIIRQKVLDEDFKYLLILDQDVIPPKDVIKKLIKHKKPAVSALFFGHHEVGGEIMALPFAWKFTIAEGDWSKTHYMNEHECFGPEQLIRIAFAGMGCILIDKEVLQKVKFRYDKSMDAWDDRWLGHDIWENEFEMFLDNSVKCMHLYKERDFNYADFWAQGLV